MKKFILFLGVIVALIAATPVYEASAQAKIMKSEFGLATDTVTNTATQYVEVSIPGNADFITFQAILTEISGTTAGTVSILGSLDGTTFKVLPVMDSQTGLATATATDVAAQSFIWRLTGNPCPYYRISWTGSGTMAATIAGRAFPNR